MKKKQKSFKKFLLLFLIGMLFLTAIYVILQIATNKNPEKNSEIQKCIADYTNSQIEFAEGTLLIVFAEGIAEREAKEIIASYRLSIENSLYGINTLVVKIPKGREIEWLCKIKSDKHPEIASIGLNTIVYATNSQGKLTTN